jgi:hypothetical protein
MQETPAFLLPWLYSAVCFLVMKFMTSVVMIARADQYARVLPINISEVHATMFITMFITVDLASIVTLGVLNLIGVALDIYFFIVVFNFYAELRNGVRSICPAVGSQPGLAPGAFNQPGTSAIRGYSTQGAGRAIAQQGVITTSSSPSRIYSWCS